MPPQARDEGALPEREDGDEVVLAGGHDVARGGVPGEGEEVAEVGGEGAQQPVGREAPHEQLLVGGDARQKGAAGREAHRAQPGPHRLPRRVRCEQPVGQISRGNGRFRNRKSIGIGICNHRRINRCGG